MELSFWESIKSSTDAEDFQAYLDKYPNGQFVALAERRVKKKSTKVDEAAVRTEVPLASEATFRDCADCPEMVVIPAGKFEMGGNQYDGEKPVHTVRIGKAFAIGKTEVTQGQWRAVMGKNLSRFSSCGDSCPAELVSWASAKEFVQKLSAKTGKTYRLPTEAEWEYACRAGGDHSYCGSENIDSVARYESNSDGKTRPVAGKQANAWGVYDMSGNVWEWTEDCWNGSYNGAPSDGSAWTSGDCELHVIRGGSYDHVPQYARSAFRSSINSRVGHQDLGFRLARMLDQSSAAKPDSVKSEAATHGLEWADSDNDYEINWSEAKQYCASKGSGWRLPSISELLSSYQSGQETPCASWTCKVASKSRLTSPWFWTNEQRGSSAAWAIILTSGNRSAAPVENPGILRALCVRDR
jgi:formylglycine-generating enzyme required for sulfatase activity